MAVDIIARLKLNAQEFSRGMKVGFAEAARDAEKQGTTAGTRFSTGFTNGLRALATGAIGAAIGAAVSRSLDYAASLGEVSQQLGVTTRELQVYRFAALEAGVSTKQMDDSLAKLTLGVGRAAEGNKRMTEVFAGLGVSVLDAGGNVRATGDVFLDLADALSKIPDPAKRAEAEVAIFGKTGQKLDTILRGGSAGVNDLAASADKLGIVLDEKLIGQADEAADKLAAMKHVMEAKMASIVAENADAFIALADAIGSAVSMMAQFIGTANGAARLDAHAGFVRRANSIIDQNKSWSEQQKEQIRAEIARRADKRYGVRTEEQLGGLFTTRTALPLPSSTGSRPRSTTLPGSVPSVSGAGGPRTTRASNDNEAARAMERQRDAAADLSAKLADIVQRERDSANLARIRAERGEDAADWVQAELEITRQFPELEGKRVGDITSYHGTSVKVTQEMLDQLAVAKQLVGAEVDRNKEAKKREKFADIGREGLAAVDQIFEDYEKQAEERQEAERRRIEDLAYLFEDVFRDGTGAIWDNFKREGERVLADFASKQLLSVLGKAGIGGDVLGKIGKNASLGAALGPAVNNILGMKGSSTGGALGGAIGSFIPIPGGNIIGSIIGSTIGGLLKKAKYGTTVLSNGQLSTAGNSGSARSASVGGANSIQDGLAQIAEALGGDIGAYNVSIGTYKGKWRVSPSGYGGKLKVKNGAVDFGKDGQAEAIRFAISDALSDGAIKGISDAAQRILKSGQDLDKALQKAVDIESIPKLLKARLDPLGAALEAVDDKFSKLAATLKEGGASAEQIADARKLWQLEREDTLAQIGQASAGLKDFLSGLKAGSASPFSLRDQEKAAREALAPFQAKIAAGQTIDVDAFTQAADTFLSVQRGIYGSTGPFFEALAQVSQLTEQAIAKIDAQTSGTGAAKDPFAEMTATAAQATATNTQSAAQILEQQTQMLADIRNALAGGGIPANAAWLSTWRGFVRAA